MPQPSPFTPALFHFFRDLKRNNEKPWFEANRQRYEEDVLDPCRTFVLAFRPHLRAISEHFQAEPKVQGGSLFRIHANLRFNPGGPPYKEQTGIQFRHLGGKDVHAPGFYLHLEPEGDPGGAATSRGGCFAGMGTWHPDPPTLRAIREAIVEDPEGWKKAAHGRAFRNELSLAGDSLKRGPTGFDLDHPLIDDIKRKDFIAVAPLTEADVVSDGFLELFADRCRRAAPFVRWLCAAVDAPF
jgi:uncharacterized protein (TIGR02453 family)